LTTRASKSDEGREDPVKKATSALSDKQTRRVRSRAVAPDERYDANVDLILRAATAVFAEKGFGGASVRDIAARAHISFPRIYYYLQNKEQLLYLVSRHVLERLLNCAQDRLEQVADPEQRLRVFIESHVQTLTENLPAVKVMVRDVRSLSHRYAASIARLMRDYSRICRQVIEEAAASHGQGLDREDSRVATLLLFGAMNGLWSWYEPSRDSQQRKRIIDELWRMALGTIRMRQRENGPSREARP
jgi:TetR/AcrR family transcriptional regulator, cholesterol catabolism regulator